MHEFWWWNCPVCGGWRPDLEHVEMGSGTSRRAMARLSRFARHVRFTIPYYAGRLLGRSDREN
jgi:hypothetical protein